MYHFWGQQMCRSPMYIYIYIYVHACCAVIFRAKFGQIEGYYLGQVCFFLKLLSKITRTRALHIKRGAAAQYNLRGYYLNVLQKAAILKTRKLCWSSAPKTRCDVSAIFSAIFWRFSRISAENCYFVSGVAPANQTKERSVHELFAGAFRNKNSMWIELVFLRKNTRIHKNGRNSWTFRFGPFFGLVCRGDSWLYFAIWNAAIFCDCDFWGR